MTQSLMRPFGVPNHRPITRGERDALANEIRQECLSVSSHDPKVIQIRKDLYQGKNRAPDTIATLIADSHNAGNSLADRITATIGGFLSAHAEKLRRTLSELIAIETREEGELNNTQMEYAQGNRSRVTLIELKRKNGELRDLLNEMEDAIDLELFGPPAQ